MALETTFRNLPLRLDQLHDALETLQVTLGDKPLHQDLAVIDGLENSLLDVVGDVHEAKKSALTARKSVGPQPDLDRARRALVECQKKIHRMEQLFAENLVSYERLRELVRLGEKGKEWRSWSESTRLHIEQLWHPLQQVKEALASCWQELAERLGMLNVSVHTVGQEIRVRKHAVATSRSDRVT